MSILEGGAFRAAWRQLRHRPAHALVVILVFGLGIGAYSDRSHEVAVAFARERSAELIALSERMSNEFRSYYLGREEEVLFEDPAEIDGKTMYVGYTKEYVKVATESEESLENVMRRGRIDHALTDEIYYME